MAITERLHARLHKLPGMPPHAAAERLHRHAPHPGARTGHHPSPARPNGHHARPPRVLVAWQTWIGRLFTGRGDHR